MPIKPRHIHFECWAGGSSDSDQCDFHLYSLEQDPTNADQQATAYNKKFFVNPKGPNGYARKKDSDIFLFRFGYFDYIKLNVESMIRKYEAEKWYTIDLIIEWSEQLVSIYIDGEGISA